MRHASTRSHPRGRPRPTSAPWPPGTGRQRFSAAGARGRAPRSRATGGSTGWRPTKRAQVPFQPRKRCDLLHATPGTSQRCMAPGSSGSPTLWSAPRGPGYTLCRSSGLPTTTLGPATASQRQSRPRAHFGAPRQACSWALHVMAYLRLVAACLDDPGLRTALDLGAWRGSPNQRRRDLNAAGTIPT